MSYLPPGSPGQGPGLGPMVVWLFRAGLKVPAVAIDDPPRHHLPERLPVLGFSLHGGAQQDYILDDALAIWRENRKAQWFYHIWL